MKKHFLIILLLVLVVQGLSAQSKSKTTNQKKSSASAQTFNWGIGLRLGDPLGVTLKRYLAEGKSLEFNLGRSANWGYNYADRFYDNNKWKTYDYLAYKANNAVTFQLHFLFHKDIQGAKGLQWYWGVGPQLRFKSYAYSYRYDGGNSWVYVTEDVTDVDFGADAVLGLEYRIKSAPLAVFADANLFLELLNDPLFLYAQGGVGIRYNF
jgi:hypothetical protein